MRVRWLLTVCTLVVLGTVSSNAYAVHIYGEVGGGLPEIAHARVGAYIEPRFSVEAYGADVLFNWLVGAGVTGYLLGTAEPDGPPRHSLAVQGTVAVNPAVRPIRVTTGGEEIGAAMLFNVGYAYTTDLGFFARVWLGGILIFDQHLAGGPNFTVGVGWRF